MTLNFGFFYGTTIDNHSKYELFAAIVVNLIATILKLGDKTQLGSVLLATSLVADIQLITTTIWTFSVYSASGVVSTELIECYRIFIRWCIISKYYFCGFICF